MGSAMNGLLSGIKNNFLATGVGSLPHEEPSAAVDLVFKVLSHHIPFWPQLPRRSFCENMYAQFSEKLPGVVVREREKAIMVMTQGQEFTDSLEDCFDKCNAGDVDSFAIGRPYAEGLYAFSNRLMELNWQGWVKAQIIGPFSLGLSLLDENKNPILYHPELTQLLPMFLSLKASWIIQQIKVNARTKIIIFIDELYLVAVGTSQNTLPRREIIDKINTVIDVVHANGALAGIHCCGNTDWDLVMATRIDILNFDAYGYLEKILLYEKTLSSFLKNGGIPAFGIVPTSDDIGQDGLAEHLFKKLTEHKQILANGALITPSCGSSGMSEDSAGKTLKISVELAERLRREF